MRGRRLASHCGGESRLNRSRERSGFLSVSGNKSPDRGQLASVARARTVAGYAVPGIIVFFFWVVVVILVIILLAFIVHWAGGGVLDLRLGHFVLNVGFT